MQTIRINRWLVETDKERVIFKWLGLDGKQEPNRIATYLVETIVDGEPRELKVVDHEPLWTVKDYEMVAIVGWLKGVTK